ncbi:MAG: hypothetical protein AAGC53_03695 [Actinomycetota bacterium]
MSEIPAETAKDDNPFTPALASLNELASALAPTVEPLSTVNTICVDISNVLDAANDVPSALDDCSDALTALAELADLLEAVPIIDVVVGPIVGIVETVSTAVDDARAAVDGVITDVVTPGKQIFDDLADGTKSATNLISDVTQTVPDYVNTLSILSYCLDIAQILLASGAFAGTAPEETTKSFVDGMVAIDQGIAAPIEALSSFADDFAQAINAIDAAFSQGTADLEAVLGDVQAGLNTFASITDPIVDALHKVESAIAPVRWVLHAVDSVIKHVLEPILNEVLKVTGLESLVDHLKDALLTAIGVQPLVKALNGLPASNDQHSWQQSAGSSAGTAATSNWTTLSSGLAQYDTRNSDNTHQLISNLVEALVAAPSTGGPYHLPPLTSSGDLPKLTWDHAANAAAASSATTKSSLERYVPDPDALEEPATPTTATTSATWLTSALTDQKLIRSSYDGVSKNLTGLLDLATTAKDSLASAEAIGAELSAGLTAFDRARSLPSDYETTLVTLETLFDDCSKVVEFLAGVDIAKDLFSDIDPVLQQQAQAVAALASQTSDLTAASAQVDKAITAVSSQAPNPSQFASYLQCIDAAATGAALIGNAARRGQALNLKLDGQFDDRLGQVLKDIDDAAGDACDRMQLILDATTTALKHADSINTAMANYAAGWTAVVQASSPIKKTALPGLTSGGAIANTIASLVDPVSGILGDLGCDPTDGNPMRKYAQGQVGKLETELAQLIQDHSGDVTSAFAFATQTVIPTDDIQGAITDLSGQINDSLASLTADTAALANAFEDIENLMVPSLSYDQSPTPSSDGTPQTVANFLIGQKLRDELIALQADMSNAAVAAGLGGDPSTSSATNGAIQ